MNTSKLILVAGGAGFVGSHLCDRLVADKDNLVVCIDNLSTGSEKNISHLRNKDNFIFQCEDICNNIPDWYAASEIYNLACPASPIHYQSDPIHTTKTNVIGTTNLLELARISGAKFLQASTSEVYGDALVHPQSEGYWGNVNPDGVRSCYDEGKRCAESLCFDYNRQYGVPVKVVRIFNTYGPRMARNDGRVVSNFIVQALAGKPLTIYGKGEQTRSFQYIDDLIDGMVAMMATDESVLGPVNIGNPGEFTIKELAVMVLNLTKSDSTVKRLPLPADDPRQRRPDITRAQELLGWEPKVDLKTGLRKTIDYFKRMNIYD